MTTQRATKPDVDSVLDEVLIKRADALRDAERRLRRAVSIGTIGVLFFNLDGRMTDANDAFVRMSGYARDELLSLSWKVLTPPDFVDVTARAAAELAAHGETAPYEKQLVRKDGTRWWGLFAPTRLAGSGPDSECVEFIIDITGRKRAEEALREQEARLQLALDASGMGTFVWYPDDDRGEPDERMLAMFGLPAGRTITLADALGALLHTDDRERYAKAVARALDPDGPGTLTEEVRFRRPDGSAWVCSVTARVHVERGRPVRMAGIVADITERKRAEEALRDSEARQAFLLKLADRIRPVTDARLVMEGTARALAEHLDVAAVGYGEVAEDEDAIVVDAEYNDGRMPSAVGRHRFSAYPDNFRARLRAGEEVYADDVPEAAAPPAARALSLRSVAIVPLHKAGRLAATFYAMHPEPREWSPQDRRIIREVAERTWAAVERARAETALRDSLAEQVAARRSAEEAARARDEFLSIAYHELRNPVAAVYGTTQLLARSVRADTLTDERLRQYVDALESAGGQLARLTNDLLDVSRLQHGTAPLRVQRHDLVAVVRDMLGRVPWTAHPFVLESGSESLEAEFDRDRIELVIGNLLDNAIKYSDGSPRVVVRVRRDGDDAVVEVMDRGIGLPRGSQEAIFAPFRRGENAPRNSTGLGLGLYRSRMITRQHGGDLTARSRGAGRGTTMALKLPMTPPPDRDRSG